MLGNQRNELQQAILNAPKHRIDNLASFVEHHARRLSLMLRILLKFYKKRSSFLIRGSLIGLCVSLFFASGVGLYLDLVVATENTAGMMAVIWAILVAILFYGIWGYILYKPALNLLEFNLVHNLEDLVSTKDQLDMDSLKSVTHHLKTYFQDEDRCKTSVKELVEESETLNDLYTKGAQEIRIAIHQLDEFD